MHRNAARWGALSLVALMATTVAARRGDSLPPPPAPSALPPAAAGEATVVSGSLHIPDVLLLDQDGRQVRFWRDLVAGKVVAVSFIFTTCTTICPPLGANFGRLGKLLGSHPGNPAQAGGPASASTSPRPQVALISISVDPAHDTPARLKAWAAQFGAGPDWTLLTGAKPDVDRLLRALQAYTANVADHSPLLLIGNAVTGSWERTSGLQPAAAIAARLSELDSLPAGGRMAAP